MILVLPPLGLTHQSTYPTWTIKKQARIQKKTPPVKHGSNVVFAWVPASGEKNSWPNIIYPKYQNLSKIRAVVRFLWILFLRIHAVNGGALKTWGISTWRCFGRHLQVCKKAVGSYNFSIFFVDPKKRLERKPKEFVGWLEMSI